MVPGLTRSLSTGDVLGLLALERRLFPVLISISVVVLSLSLSSLIVLLVMLMMFVVFVALVLALFVSHRRHR